jgi:hypothetical protein
MELDVRCDAVLSGMRCQLRLGHEGLHALVSGGTVGRLLHQWGADAVETVVPVAPDNPGALSLPWAPGLPIYGPPPPSRLKKPTSTVKKVTAQAKKSAPLSNPSTHVERRARLVLPVATDGLAAAG